MWCPRCRSEFREGFTTCNTCGAALVAEEPPEEGQDPGTGPLTGRPIDDELSITGPVLAGTFVTMDEAQAAAAALADEGIVAEVVNRDEQLPMTIQKAEPAFGITVQPTEASRARRILRGIGLLPVAIARFRTEDLAHEAKARLEAEGLEPRVSCLVMDEIPEDIRADMDPYLIEVPATQESAAFRALEGTVRGRCEACGSPVRFGEISCSSCGEYIG
jgi:hypothetical protein